MIKIDRFFVTLDSGDLFFAEIIEDSLYKGIILNMRGEKRGYTATPDEVRPYFLQPGDYIEIQVEDRIISRAKVGKKFSLQNDGYAIEIINSSGIALMAPLHYLKQSITKFY